MGERVGEIYKELLGYAKVLDERLVLENEYVEIVKSVLDEVKKEFPMANSSGTNADIDLRVMLAKRYFEAVDKWFEKWFGEAKKE